MPGFLGMRGSGQFTTNELPQDWDEVIMREYPNGQTPIFAIQSMMPEDTAASSDYNWWTETVPAYSGAVTNVYIDAALATPYVYATHQATKGIAGATVYVNVSEADALMAVVGQTVALRDADRPTATVRGRVTAQSLNGTSSYVAVMLIEADDNAIDGDGTDVSATYNLSTVDRFIFMASAYPWGSGTPQASSYTPVQFSNRTQIHRTVFSLSRTSKAQKTRTGDIFDNDRIRTMYKHAQGWEWTAIFGHNYATVDPDSKQPLYYTEGILDWVLTNNSTNFVDFRYATDSAFSGKTWEEAGEEFLDTYLEQLFRFAPDNLLGLCGGKAAQGINKLAKTGGSIQLVPTTEDYGLKVINYITNLNQLPFKVHPLMSRETSTQNMMIIYVPGNCKLCPLVNNGENGKDQWQDDLQVKGTDGTTQGFLGEQGWKFYFPNQWLILDGIGLDNQL